MRVIAGSARRLPLKTIPGMDTRPTTDRIKETLFNMLSTDIPGAVFVDLFAGSGQMGIEALSRGADKVWFAEKNPKALACIRENLKFTRLEDRAEVLGMDVLAAVGHLEKNLVSADIVFFDPPYQAGLEMPLLTRLEQSSVVTEDTLLIAEADLKHDFSWVEDTSFTVIKTKEYKTNKHVFMKRKA